MNKQQNDRGTNFLVGLVPQRVGVTTGIARARDEWVVSEILAVARAVDAPDARVRRHVFVGGK